LAAKVAPLRQHVAVSPEAIFQRMNKRALAVLQELIRQAFAKLQSCQAVGEANRFTPLARVHLADSTGFERPDSLKSTFPGSGGSAAPAGEKTATGGGLQKSGISPLGPHAMAYSGAERDCYRRGISPSR
jgi:hypothetical protein